MNDRAAELERALREAAQQAAQLRLLADHVPVLMALYDAASQRCLFANRAYAQTFGHDEQTVLGHTFAEIIGPEAARLIQPQVDQVLRDGSPAVYERHLSGPDGQSRWLEVHLVPHLDEGGAAPSAVSVLISDISKHRLAERAARESEARLEKFMQASVEGIVFHREGQITDANPPLCALLGYSLDELLSRHVLSFVAEDELAKVTRVMTEGRELRYETAVIHRDGTRIPVEFIVRTLEREGERLRMTIVRDIRDRVAAQARIHHLAHHDALTSLLNRAAFMEQLQQALRRASGGGKRQPDTLALLFIDLDNFKRVNDSLGHLEGDKVLTTVAERLRACLRASDLVGRFGGDEFVVLLADVESHGDVLVVLRDLLSVVEVPVSADGRALSVTPSIGVAMYPEHGQSADELIQHADTAMYLAKSRGRANYQFFEPALAQNAYDELVLESELAQALERDEFVLHYQPQLSTDGALIGAEALLRWQHPQRGLLSPDAFIDVAERHRLMLALGEWVMRSAAAQARDWHQREIAAVPIAVNLSRMQFHLEGFAGTVARVLGELHVPGHWIELELTERMLMDDIANAPATLKALRALGLSVSVDDFGTGYTSLAHLTQLPLDKLKIDQSFVAKLPADVGAAAIVQAIIQMADGLGLRVSAEGVRNGEQRALLAGWGCDEMQGELLGAPMAPAEFERWLLHRHGAAA
ncbi:putative bifunctional diguanylate cyclase/phosphodiesterase [Roseateles violae]|uniref:EAL domain-containing protein n=1 Tax=Roseateles violae TaxID=3058042 RepID=A0ABT8DTQ1_9BURK|nr:EAL domain-containing protein [Pelomonas sp. PFR6]MDN3921378.1 EAL domain-containing protein [Pelomonas sp. PFR6]